MKKSLLAVAAMTAFAGAAQAQSSVTVYGILDVGFVGSSYNGTATTPNTSNTDNIAGTGGVTQKQTTSGFGQSAESTSRLGFKGSEDLGGGSQAIFTLEVGQNPNGSTEWGTINRQTFVGLHKNGAAAVTIGTQYTPVFDVQSATDAAGNNNLVGNAVYSSSLQSGGGTFNQGLGPYAQPATVNTTSTTAQTQGLNGYSGYTTRASNALKVQSDRIAGLQGELYYGQVNQNNTQTGTTFTATGGVQTNTVYGLNLDYQWKKLQVVAATQAFRAYTTSGTGATGTVTTATSSSLTGTSVGATGYGYQMNDNQTYAAATYDFGIAKGYLQYLNRRAVSTIDSSYTTSKSAYQLGARSQLTPVISAYATYGVGRSQYYGQNLGYNNFRAFQLGTDYYLSKRTNLYVAYGAVSTSSANTGVAVQSTTAGSNAPQNASISGSNYAVGIRHTF
jgi:predicted porin